MNSVNAEKLEVALDALRAFLQSCPEPEWVDQIVRIQDMLRARTPPSFAAALELIRNLFGGMGSLNDLWISEQNQNLPVGMASAAANARLGELLDGLFASLANVYGVSVSTTGPLPPRIAASFRKRDA